ncbi:MAG: hypothetical protein CLLPBCKN_000233 [Chroococcidiopsis cubana SAG 39.79]|uniref:MIP18 family-like domain-containing protein n=1 Tax=Chroococcidiopsis cubana SAG 39.79 TaxID=388085 RepID=A0AB37UJ05_9CYAN|nr:hypothetical protein [Chroococcidiopsis cubana]MDZ4870845.1 hypothetical protein [Chroococcidiopsis cubana SAG 39.79]PSB57718.1 hypothetical protein C7B79_30665 [Chroococcidiopsis cubana CCALA 043]RUT11352.1 hypothetical protein DSM107010_33910 [Chroococcidiopsis cubana SAG 39.79]
MNLFSKSNARAEPERVQQIKTWIYELLKLDLDTPISIIQLRCTEPGCPLLETAIAVMTVPTKTYKIHKPIAEIAFTDIANAMQQK